MNFYYISFIGSIFFAYIFLRYLLPFLQRNLLDVPNLRSSHVKPIPKGGGIVFVIIGSFGALLFGNFIPIYCIPISLIAFLDDKINLPVLVRYFVQISTSFLILINYTPTWLIDLDMNFILKDLLYFFIVFSMTAIINFSNFMDGLDGFLSSTMLIIFLFISHNFLPSYYPLCGALIGFIIWNWQPAKIFMGDVGSIFLGSIFAGSLLEFNSIDVPINLLLCASPILIDPVICVIRRFFTGQNIFLSHKSHLYQRLHQAGWSHSKVSLTYAFAIFIICMVNRIYGLSIQSLVTFIILCVGIILDKFYASPFKPQNTNNFNS